MADHSKRNNIKTETKGNGTTCYFNPVFFNQCHYEDKSRDGSGWHKGETIKMLHRAGLSIQYFFEDDEVQKAAIEEKLEEVAVWNIGTRVIHVNNPHVKKENRRHLEDLHD